AVGPPRALHRDRGDDLRGPGPRVAPPGSIGPRPGAGARRTRPAPAARGAAPGTTFPRCAARGALLRDRAVPVPEVTMEFFDAVFARRTTNGPFRPDPVSPEHQQLLIRAAAAAPSQFNSQPWRFVLIEDPATIGEVARISGESMTRVMGEGTFFHRYRKYFRFSQEEMDRLRSGMLFDRLPALLRPFTSRV